MPNSKTLLLLAAGLLMLADLYLIFMVAPTDAVMGDVQRVFYFHVPVAIVSFLAFLSFLSPAWVTWCAAGAAGTASPTHPRKSACCSYRWR